MAPPDLSLTEWMVLALIAERPCHGFAVASLTGADEELGQFWYVSQPMVYRSITRLTEKGFIEPIGSEESERGPQRVVFAATRSAKSAVTRWLSEPVAHLRDIRADLMIKLVLLRRRGASSARLIERQRVVVQEIEAVMEARADTDDYFNRALYDWRLGHARATLKLLDTLASEPPPERDSAARSARASARRIAARR